MFLASSNPPRNLLVLRYIDRIEPEDLVQGRNDVAALLAELQPNLRVLVDLTQLDQMNRDCVPEIGKNMELIDQRGVELVVRVIPDPLKDIGLNILTAFHYKQRPNVVTCKNLTEAGEALGLYSSASASTSAM